MTIDSNTAAYRADACNQHGALRSAACAIALAVFGVPSADGAVVGDYTARAITEVFSYPEYGQGDVMFRVTPVVPGCEGGFWLRPSDPGFKTSVATMLLGYSTKVAVRVWGYDDQLWSGSSATTCRLYAIGLA